jgi:tRNA G10  N-methylase Trm11
VSAEDAVRTLENVAVTRRNYLWLLGPHRLLCGDATSTPDYQRLMRGAIAQVQFTDPPFNRRTRTFSGRGRVRHRDFVRGAGEMTEDAYIDLLTRFLEHSSQVLADGGISFTFIDLCVPKT